MHFALPNITQTKKVCWHFYKYPRFLCSFDEDNEIFLDFSVYAQLFVEISHNLMYCKLQYEIYRMISFIQTYLKKTRRNAHYICNVVCTHTEKMWWRKKKECTIFVCLHIQPNVCVAEQMFDSIIAKESSVRQRWIFKEVNSVKNSCVVYSIFWNAPKYQGHIWITAHSLGTIIVS